MFFRACLFSCLFPDLFTYLTCGFISAINLPSKWVYRSACLGFAQLFSSYVKLFSFFLFLSFYISIYRVYILYISYIYLILLCCLLSKQCSSIAAFSSIYTLQKIQKQSRSIQKYTYSRRVEDTATQHRQSTNTAKQGLNNAQTYKNKAFQTLPARGHNSIVHNLIEHNRNGSSVAFAAGDYKED